MKAPSIEKYWAVNNVTALPRGIRRRCRVCSTTSKKKVSKWKCETCNITLCIDNCFRIYHQDKNYKKTAK